MRCLVAEITWIVRLLHDLSAPPILPIPFHCDNQATIHIAKNPVFHERMKHIELADLFTKSLAGPLHRFLLGKLGVRSPASHLRGVLPE